MYVAPIDRARLLSFLPADGVVAEIGVAEGDFSARILREGRARELHLIDPWEHQDRADYLPDSNNVGAAEQESRFRKVAERFAPEIAAGRVHMHRDFSDAALARFADGTFDWVYVDAMHTLEAVSRDLALAWDKVKEDGFVLGHDFSNGPLAEAQNFGVVEAVNRFVVERQAIFVAMTMEVYPSYLLAKKVTPRLTSVIENLLVGSGQVVEIRGVPKSFRHVFIRAQGQAIFYPSF